jgi:hypothetical protein
MEPEQQLTFGPFQLAAHPGRLVTKAEVQQQVWVGTRVSDSVLRASVQEIRIALGEAATCYLADVTWLCEESIEAAVHLPEDIARHVEWFTEGFDTVDIQEAKALVALIEVLHVSGVCVDVRSWGLTADRPSSGPR